MQKLIALTGVGLMVSGVCLASPAMAAEKGPKTSPGKLTVYMAFGTREVLDLGQPGTTVGDITVGTGPMTKKLGGTSIGDYVYRAETVTVLMPGASENRLATIWVNLPGGSLAATSLLSVPGGAPPVKKQEFVVLGGTGKYAGVDGTMTLKPISQPRASRLVFTFAK